MSGISTVSWKLAAEGGGAGVSVQVSRSMIWTLSSDHLPSLGMLLLKKMTWGGAKRFCCGTYLVLVIHPFLSDSAMLYRWSECSACALLMSKMQMRSLLYRYAMSLSAPDSTMALWFRTRCLAKRDLPFPPWLSRTQMMCLSSAGCSSRLRTLRCHGLGSKPLSSSGSGSRASRSSCKPRE